MDPTWIVRLDAAGDGPRLAVKDCVDVEGLPTTAGCQVVAELASPAAADAPVVAAARRADRRQDQPHRAVLVGERGQSLVGDAGEPGRSPAAARRIVERLGGG